METTWRDRKERNLGRDGGITWWGSVNGPSTGGLRQWRGEQQLKRGRSGAGGGGWKAEGLQGDKTATAGRRGQGVGESSQEELRRRYRGFSGLKGTPGGQEASLDTLVVKEVPEDDLILHYRLP